MLKVIVNLFYRLNEQLKVYLQANSDFIVPINGGASLKDDLWCRNNALFDDTGDNISDHNSRLNENTSIYWFWKHIERFEPLDYCGFSHYRRFFPKYVIEHVNEHDIVVAQPIKCIYSLEWQYAYYHSIEDLQKCIAMLKSLNQKNGSSFEEYMRSRHDNFAPMNMFVMRKDLFIEWCEFIFPILFRLEHAIDTTGRDNYQKRAICFLEERIFGWWAHMKKQNGLDVAEAPIEEHLDWKGNNLNERGTYG